MKKILIIISVLLLLCSCSDVVVVSNIIQKKLDIVCDSNGGIKTYEYETVLVNAIITSATINCVNGATFYTDKEGNIFK